MLVTVYGIPCMPHNFFIQYEGVGVDNIDVATATKCGILVMNTVGTAYMYHDYI